VSVLDLALNATAWR